MIGGISNVAAPQEQKSQTVVRARELGLDRQRAAVTTHRLVQLTKLRVGDRHVLQHFVIIGLLSEGQTVGRERGVVVPLPLEREGFAEIVEVLGLRFRLSAGEAVPE